MALPLAVGPKVLGAVTVQSTEERAFGEDDILTLQTMADHLAIAINNAQLLRALDRANAELLRTKTYEALATATTQAVHWIGNKALPITTTIARIKGDLEKDPLDVASIREDLDLIDESARLIVDVKENLLGPAREQKPRPAMLEDVVQAAAYHVGIAPTQLALNVASDTPMVLADTTQLARALGNLFRNSLEAAAAHVVVTIAPAEEQGYVSLDIVDDGEGIPAEMIDKIWAAFVTTKGSSHTGLGLPACLHVISQLDGRISAVSEAGRGTTFTVLLPASAEAGPVAADQEAGQAKTDKRTSHILLIDDEDPWAQFAVNTLTAAGYWVTRATKLDGKVKPDVIMVDETLLAGPVADILEKLKASGLIGRTLIVSAALNVERTAGYLKAGVKDVILKPYTMEEFALALAV